MMLPVYMTKNEAMPIIDKLKVLFARFRVFYFRSR